MGEWGILHEVVEHKYNSLTVGNRQKACRLAAASAFGLHNWESMEQHVRLIPQDSQDGAFYRAILAIHKEQVNNFPHFCNCFETVSQKRIPYISRKIKFIGFFNICA